MSNINIEQSKVDKINQVLTEFLGSCNVYTIKSANLVEGSDSKVRVSIEDSNQSNWTGIIDIQTDLNENSIQSWGESN